MDDLLTPANIMFAIGILSVIFTVFNYFRNPQESLEKKQALADKDISGKASVLAQKEVENKAALLAQQVTSEKELNEKKFLEFGGRLDKAFELAQNHIHTVDTKVDSLVSVVNTMSNEITKLSTIIEERIPKK